MARRVSGKKMAKGGKAVHKAIQKKTSNQKRVARKGPSSQEQNRPMQGFEGEAADGPRLRQLVEKLREDVWPNERPVLFNPDRLKYVRKLVKPSGCVFCAAAEAGPSPESLLVFKNELAMVVLNKYPYNNGHLLILPRRHCGEFLALTEEELREINRCLQRGIKALQEAYGPAGFNVGLNLGSAAGAGIPEHLHYHVIPRWMGDTNFFPLIAETKVVVETLEQTYERLLPYFQG